MKEKERKREKRERGRRSKEIDECSDHAVEAVSGRARPMPNTWAARTQVPLRGVRVRVCLCVRARRLCARHCVHLKIKTVT